MQQKPDQILSPDFKEWPDRSKWPRAGDTLFRSDVPDWQHNAVIGTYPEMAQWLNYVEGYRAAADLAARAVMEGTFERDTLVFPIIFLYRHHFEIALKTIIILVPPLSHGKSKPKLIHKLPDLWADAKKVIQSHWPFEFNPEEAIFTTIEDCFQQLADLDPGSTAFRYPTDKRGKPSVPEYRLLNVRNLAEVAGRISDFLEDCTTALWEAVGQKENFLKELRTIAGPQC